MAEPVVVQSILVTRRATAAQWAQSTYVALTGELMYETDTRKFKFGNGRDTYTELEYASASAAQVDTRDPGITDAGYDIGTVWINISGSTRKAFVCVNNAAGDAVWKQIITPDELSSLGYGDMLQSVYATNAEASDGYVDKAQAAKKLTTARTIGLTGAASGTASFDGSENVSISVVLTNTGVVAGTYQKVTVGADGRVTVGMALAEGDIPELRLAKIVDAGTAAGKNVGTGAGMVPLLDANGKLNDSVIPALAISEPHVCESEAEMLALTAQTGDVAMRSDIRKTYILKQTPASTLANWIELLTPLDAVSSVNGKTGVVVLTTDDVGEGANLYFTTARANSAFDTRFSTKTAASLSDGDKIMFTDQVFIFDGGGPDGIPGSN